jgi:microcystin-dependent protein
LKKEQRMSDQFLGEIRTFSFGWAPKGWVRCDGSLLSIQQFAALFALLGTAFGGDGKTTFAVPDLRGRTPVSPYPQQNLNQGNNGGLEQVTLNQTQIPQHSHGVSAALAIADRSGIGATTPSYLGTTSNGSCYAPAAGATLTTLDPSAVGITGGAAHQNMQPSLVVNFCISTTGIFPQRP